MMLCDTQNFRQLLFRYSVYVAAAFVLPFFLMHTTFAQTIMAPSHRVKIQQQHALPCTLCFAKITSKQILRHRKKLIQTMPSTEAVSLSARLSFSFLRAQQISVAKFSTHHKQNANDRPQPFQALLAKDNNAQSWVDYDIAARQFATNRILTKIYRCFPASDFDTKT